MLLNDRDQIIAMTAEWTGERYPNGRPCVSDEKIEILKNLTQEEIWQPLYSCGYRFQFQGDLKPLHPDKKLYGRAVTCCFMPQRPDLRQHVFNVARSRGWKGDCNQWVIDSLEESDVVVCDLYDKILRGTFVGGNLTTAVKARTKNGGVVVWGGVRDLEQMQNIDVQVFYRGVDPTPIRDCQITAFNGPCRIGAAICLPGDIVIGTKNGILFVPSHMVDYVIEHAYKSQVRDLYAFPKLEAGIYTTADVDAVVWNDQMMQALAANQGNGKKVGYFEKGTTPKLLENHKAALTDMITRDKNHASVIAWSILNEPQCTSAGTEAYFKPLFDLAHELDPQKRPRTYAIVMMSLPNNSKGQQFADFISLNRYYGWYVMGGMCIVDAETAFRKEMDGWAQVLNGRPMIFTEYGADTMPSEHKLPSVMWSQEYQNEYLDMNHNVFDSYDFVQGELVWNFADFQTTEGIMRANGNKKGIFTRQRQPKDAAFHFRARWTSLPVDYKGNTAQF